MSLLFCRTGVLVEQLSGVDNAYFSDVGERIVAVHDDVTDIDAYVKPHPPFLGQLRVAEREVLLN